MAEGRAGALEDYATAAFSMSGVKQDISLEDWKGGWASIVGGLNGKPTSQQFNMVTYILSALLNQAISDLSTVKRTANSAMPKSDFTAKQIVSLLAAYGLMKGCDADTVDGKHANAFAPSTHEHSASQITSGNLPIERGGTGSGTAADLCTPKPEKWTWYNQKPTFRNRARVIPNSTITPEGSVKTKPPGVFFLLVRSNRL